MTDIIHAFRAAKGSQKVTFETLNMQSICPCCGMAGVNTSVEEQKFCMVCAPAYGVDEPDVDTVSVIIWLPHLDQGLLSRLLCSAYAARFVSSPVCTAEVVMASRSYDILAELEALRSEAKRRIGTDCVSVLRKLIPNIPQLSLFQRGIHLSGLRILPLGSWFDIHAEDFRKLIAARN